MDLKLKMEIDTQNPIDLHQLCQLIREGWHIGRIEKEAKDDPANKDMLFVLLRE